MKSEKFQAACSIKALRNILNKNQSQFAELIGVSKDTVVSWERKTKPTAVNAKQAKRIHWATGVTLESLRRNDGQLFNIHGQPYGIADFEQHRTQNNPPKDAARSFRGLSAWLEVLFLAAGENKDQDKLPALRMSLVDWMNEALRNHGLMADVNEILKGRSRKVQRVPVESLPGWDTSKNPTPGQFIEVESWTPWYPASNCPPKREGTL